MRRYCFACREVQEYEERSPGLWRCPCGGSWTQVRR